jgi:hypothetical protein
MYHRLSLYPGFSWGGMEQPISLAAHHPACKESKYHANIGWREGELGREGRLPAGIFQNKRYSLILRDVI